MTFRPLPWVLFLTALALWPATAGAQGRGGRGGAGAPRGAQSQRGQRGGTSSRRASEIVVVPSLGYYGPAYIDSFGVTTGYYPLGEWPAPVVASPFAPSNRANESALQAEVGRLSQEIQQLRAETTRPLPAPVAPPPSVGGNAPAAVFVPPPSLAPPVSEHLMPSTILVLRDGRHVEAQNYAIVGDTFWILDEGKSQKIPLADIDRDASEKENRGRGIRFVLAGK